MQSDRRLEHRLLVRRSKHMALNIGNIGHHVIDLFFLYLTYTYPLDTNNVVFVCVYVSHKVSKEAEA